MKTCIKCGGFKPLIDYYAHPQMADGHVNVCKICYRRQVRTHRRDNDHVRAYDRERMSTPQGREEICETAKEWASKNPEKRRAQNTLNNAVRDGRVVKLPCRYCGSSDRVHGHHYDYSKPLDVHWECARCHAQEHAEGKMASDSGPRF